MAQGFGYTQGIGVSGYSGYSGYSGNSGYSGVPGLGLSGYSGAAISGYSGYSGAAASVGSNKTISTVTSNYTAQSTDYILFADATGGSFTIVLPLVAASTGQMYVIKKSDTTRNIVTINGNGTIDAQLTYLLQLPYEFVTIVCDGTQWLIVSE